MTRDKPVNLIRWAQAGKPLKTSEGERAVFIAYVPKAKKRHRLIVRVGEDIWLRQTDGRHCETCNGNYYQDIVKDET